MHQAFDAFFQLDESTVRHEVDDLPAQAAADRVAVLDAFPRVVRLLLQTQRDAFALAVHVQNHDFELVGDVDHLGRVLDAPPTHVGDVQQSVQAVEVDEYTEIGDVLDHAFATLAFLDGLHQDLLLLAQTFFDQLPARHDDVPPFGVDLQDLELVRATHVAFRVVHGHHVNL